MKLPKLRQIATTRQTVDVFGGYNHNLRIGDGEFFEMQNMTSDHYPVLSPRTGRGKPVTEVTRPLAMVANHGVCYLDGRDFVAPNGQRIGNFVDAGAKEMLSMGGYVIILPDKKWVNVPKMLEASESDGVAEEEYCGDIEARWQFTGAAQFSLCEADGTDFSDIMTRNWAAPEEPNNGELWLDISAEPYVLRQWSESASLWTTVTTACVKIVQEGIGVRFEKGDSIRFGIGGSPEHLAALRSLGSTEEKADTLVGSAVIQAKDDNYIVIPGLINGILSDTFLLEIKRAMPEMDMVFECGNRLWGCRYGSSGADAAGKALVNEIYCSKLGDFKNWNCFQGISTDSYVVSVGADGPFTGAVSYLGRPFFFKENCIIEVHGNYPANFQLQTINCSGVQESCHKSLAIINNMLYYKSRAGVCAFDGSLPVQIGQVFGDKRYENAVAGGCRNKYYISMHEENGGGTDWHLFVYDASKGLWHREDALQVLDFCTHQNTLYCIPAERNRVITIPGTGNTDGDPVQWMVQSGQIGLSLPDMKYISRLTVRMSLEVGSEAVFSAQYDFQEDWEHLFTVMGTELRSFSVPIRPKRCDTMRLKIEGVGDAKLYSITKTIEQGSDIS